MSSSTETNVPLHLKEEDGDGLVPECQNLATRKVFLRSEDENDDDAGDYIWICEDCLPIALKHWVTVEIAVEF
jgi:hypothetical protein